MSLFANYLSVWCTIESMNPALTRISAPEGVLKPHPPRKYLEFSTFCLPKFGFQRNSASPELQFTMICNVYTT